MLTFQLLVIPLLCLVALSELRSLIKTGFGRRYHFARLSIVLAAITAISQPDLTGTMAQAVGITRGTDLVVYVFMLFTIAALFRLYTGQFLLEQRIAQLSRKEALQEAELGLHGAEQSPSATPSDELSSDA